MSQVASINLDNIPEWISQPQPGAEPLAQMQHIINQVLPGTLGVIITELNEDEVWGEIAFKPATANALGILHGGSIFTLGDTLTGCLLWYKEILAVTASSEIKYIRPTSEGKVTCHARILKREGKRIKMVCDFYNAGKKRVARMKINYAEIDSVAP